MLHRLTFAPCLMHTPSLTAILVHPSAEHIFLYCFRATFLGACSSSSLVNARFLFGLLSPFVILIFTTSLLVTAADVARVEVPRRGRVEAVVDDFFLVLFAA